MATPPPQVISRSLSDAELGDEGTVALDVLLGEVVEQLAALTDHLVQATAAVVVVDVDLEVPGQLVDAGGEDGDRSRGCGWLR